MASMSDYEYYSENTRVDCRLADKRSVAQLPSHLLLTAADVWRMLRERNLNTNRSFGEWSSLDSWLSVRLLSVGLGWTVSLQEHTAGEVRQCDGTVSSFEWLSSDVMPCLHYTAGESRTRWPWIEWHRWPAAAWSVMRAFYILCRRCDSIIYNPGCIVNVMMPNFLHHR